MELFKKPTIYWRTKEGVATNNGNINNDNILNLEVRIACVECGENHIFEVNKIRFVAFMNRASKVQYAFPHLAPNERELFLSGICSVCWDKIFKPDDDG